MTGPATEGRHNLPAQATSFVGRDREIEEVTRLVGTARLVTLAGPGGVGKTRLALEVAAGLLDTFPGGVWFVDLAPLSDPGLVPHTVAAALRVPEEPGRTVTESLVEFLRPASLLLVLDNCEHLVSASAHLADAVVRACPSVRIMVTSREPLAIPGELTYRIPPLSLPGSDPQASCEDLMRAEAVRLFVERALFVSPEFALSERNLRAVARACRRVDGLPLAIELAAARVRVLSVEEVADRLDDCFRLLTGGSRTALPRHQTLRAAIEWSHTLLSEKERALFQRVAVFAGGFDLEAAEAVCAGRGIAASEILDVLSQLVDKSLVLVEDHGGQARYRLQDTVRRYGRDRLLESGGQAEALARHRDWCLGLAERAEPELQGPDQQRWVRRLEVEHDNLREALAFALEGSSGDDALRMAAALWWFWHARGYLSEGRAWLRRALAGSSHAPPGARARALYGAGFLAWRQGEYAQAQALGQESLAVARSRGDRLGMASAISLLEQVARARGDHERAEALPEESLALFREMGDTWGVATTLIMVGNAARLRGNYTRARAALEESLELFRSLGDASGGAATLHFLGLVARDQGDYERAEAAGRESLRLSRDLGDQSRVAFALHSLGLVARDRGEHAKAEALFNESLGLFRELADAWGITTVLVSLGVAARLRGDGARAAELLRQSLTLRRDLGDKSGIAECLAHLAGIAAAMRKPERAARLLGAAEALRGSIGAQLPPAHRADCERTAAIARKRLGKRAFAEAWAAGRQMTTEQAVADGLTAAAPAAEGAGAAAARIPGNVPGPLTSREREVAALIAQGHTNRDIASALVITEGTAANHVQHILNKLGLRSRAQIAAWAAEHGLGQDPR